MRRPLSLSLVIAALAAVLAGGALTRPARVASSPGRGSSLLATVNLSRFGATVWSCPGPLPVSGGSTARVGLLNASSRSARAAVLVAETAVTAAHPSGLSLPSRTSYVTLPPHSELDLPVAAAKVPSSATRRPGSGHGAAPGRARRSRHSGAQAAAVATVDAAVSVTVTGPSVAVSESTAGPHGLLEAPCADGAGTSSYSASGVTAGSSSVEAALLDPTDSPAVVDLTVGTPNGSVQPAAFQGIPLPPRSLVLVDVGQYVPLRSRIALAATATVGTVVLGSLTSIGEHVTTGLVGPDRSYRETGEALAVGIGQPLTRAVVPLGAASPTISEAVRLFDPGSRGATVRLETTAPRGGTAGLTVDVGAGDTVTVPVPIGGRRSAAGGVLRVASEHGIGIVVAHETYRRTSAGRVAFSSSSVVPFAARTWLLPGVQQGSTVSARLALTSNGEAAAAIVEQVTAPGGSRGRAAGYRRLATISVPAGGTVVAHLGRLLPKGTSTQFGIEVVASSRLFVSCLFTAPSRSTNGATGIPASS